MTPNDYLKLNLTNLLVNENAVTFCMDLFQVSQLFDDSYDNTLTKEQTYELLELTMVKIPQNPFYQAFFNKLQPLFESNILQWQSANMIEEGDNKESLEKSYMLRANIYQIFHYCAKLLFGSEYAQQNSFNFQVLYGEKLEEYKKEFIKSELKNA